MLRCVYNLHVCCFVFSRRIKQRRRAEGASTRCGPCVCLVFPILAVVGLVPCSVNSHTALGITAQVQQRSQQRCQSHVVGARVWLVILIQGRTAEESAEMSITRIGPVRVVGQSLLAVVGLVPYSVNSHTVQRVQQDQQKSQVEKIQ